MKERSVIVDSRSCLEEKVGFVIESMVGFVQEDAKSLAVVLKKKKKKKKIQLNWNSFQHFVHKNVIEVEILIGPMDAK